MDNNPSSQIGKFRKKPVVIDAIQFTDENKDRAYSWAQEIYQAVYPAFDNGKPCLKINTLEGEMVCSLNDWIIRGVNGELYPCKPDIFEKTYEPAASSPVNGAEKLSAQAMRFIVWLFQKEEWYYDSALNLWTQDGYRSRTTQELFEYYTSIQPHKRRGEGWARGSQP